MANHWPKCPKCRKSTVELIEIWSAYIAWSPLEPYANDGMLNPGDAERVEGHCIDCGHRWKVRGVIQVQPNWFKKED